MRIAINIDEQQILALDRICKGANRPRAALIRDAVDEYLAQHRSQQADNAFGLWGERKIEGLVYQEKIRGEW